MNPDRVIPGQVVEDDDETDSRPPQPQETFLHKVASAPLGSAGRHAAGNTGYDTANADDDTEVITPADAAEVNDPAPASPADTDADDLEDADMPTVPVAGNSAYKPADDIPADDPPVADVDVVEEPDVLDAAEADADDAGVPAETDTVVAAETATFTPAETDTETGTEDANVDAGVAGPATTVAATATVTPAVPAQPSPAGDEPLLGGAAATVREEWRQVQASFVDDPRASVTAAAGLVADVTAKLESLLRERQRSLRGTSDSNGQPDTETLRQLMLSYRRLLTKLIS
jgi:hypothetical protein